MGIFLSNPKFYDTKAGKILIRIIACSIGLSLLYNVVVYFKSLIFPL